MRVVVFTAKVTPWNQGEKAMFGDAAAESYVRNGVARYVDEPQAIIPAQVSSVVPPPAAIPEAIKSEKEKGDKHGQRTR